MNRRPINNKLVHSIPTIGFVLYLILYFISASKYPGGSQANSSTKGFDWVNNYWCNLLNEVAINGMPNPARPYAILGMTILCLSMIAFFYKFAVRNSKNKYWKTAIIVCGTLSMVCAMFLFTNYHDLMTSFSSIFGAVAVIGLIQIILRSGQKSYIISGAFCILLLACNNYIYYSHYLIEFLPLLQKITFIMVLLWVAMLDNRFLYK